MVLTDTVLNKCRSGPFTSCVTLRHLSSLEKKILPRNTQKIGSYALSIAARESEEGSTYHFQLLFGEVVPSKRKKREANGY